MRACARIIQLMLRTWSGMQLSSVTSPYANYCHQGLMYFCMDQMLAIRSIVDTLRIPSLETRVPNSVDVIIHHLLTGAVGNRP